MKNKNELPRVSIIIACRNEEKNIGKCLESIINNNYPIDKIEVLVVDGMSQDDTLAKVSPFHKQLKHLHIFKNQNKTTPYAVNIGLKNVKGDYFFWLSAHSTLAINYIKTAIDTIQKYNSDSVGGVLISKPGVESNLIQYAISYSFNSPFGNGNALFRNPKIKDIRPADTVYGQCYAKNVISKYGFFNEKLTRNQDYEYNQRIIKNGGTILLNPKLVNYYSPPQTLTRFIRQAFVNGYWTILSNKYMEFRSNSPRHYMPFFSVTAIILLAVVGLWIPLAWRLDIFIVSVYITLDLYFSFLIVLLTRKILLTFVQPIIFIVLHLGYGVGSICGLTAYFNTSLSSTNYEK